MEIKKLFNLIQEMVYYAFAASSKKIEFFFPSKCALLAPQFNGVLFLREYHKYITRICIVRLKNEA